MKCNTNISASCNYIEIEFIRFEITKKGTTVSVIDKKPLFFARLLTLRLTGFQRYLRFLALA